LTGELTLYPSKGAVAEKDLVDWLEHSNRSVFRRDVLKPAHRTKLIEYDAICGTVLISPKGIAYVEQKVTLSQSITNSQSISGDY
jgi:hypothetical protein